MRLLRLKVKGFGIIRDETFEFDPSAKIAAFSGDNGSGKSTVFDAFCTLFLNEYDGALRDSINWNESSFCLEGEAVVRGKRVNATLLCQDGESTAQRTLTMEGDPTVYKNSEATKWLARLIDPKKFLATSISRQHELDIVSTGPAERREYLKKLYDLTFLKPIQSLKDKIASFENEIASLQGEADGLSGKKYDLGEKKDLPMGEVEYTKTVAQVEMDGHALYDLDLQAEKLKKTSESLLSLQADLASKNGKIKDLRDGIQQHKSDLTTLLKAEDLTSKLAAIEERRGKAETEIDDRIVAWNKAHVAYSSTEDLDQKIEEIDRRRQTSIEIVDKTIESRTKLRLAICDERVDVPSFDVEAFDEMPTKLADLRSRLKEVQASIELQKQGMCPVCKRPFDHAHDNDYAVEESSYLQAIKDAVTQQACLLADKALYDAALVKNRDVDAKLAAHDALPLDREQLVRSAEESASREIERERKAHADTLAAHLATKIDKAKEMVAIDQGAVREATLERLAYDTSVKAVKDVLAGEDASLQEMIEIIRKEGETLDDLISEVGDLTIKSLAWEEEKRSLQERKDALQAKIDLYLGAISFNEAVDLANRAVLASKDADEKRILELAGLIIEKQAQGTRHQAAKDILAKEFPSFVIARVVSKIESYMNAFIDQTYQGRYKIRIEEAKDALRILYGPKNADVRKAGGYEKQVFSIAWKYAKERLDGVGLLLLDEVDSAASDRSSKIFYEVITKLPYDQILAISHRSQIKELLRSEHRAQVFDIENGKIAI